MKSKRAPGFPRLVNCIDRLRQVARENMTCTPRDLSDPQEDVLLVRLVEEHGTKNWSIIAKGIPGRTGKSCRIRYARPGHAERACGVYLPAHLST